MRLLAPPETSATTALAAGRCIFTSLAPPEMRTGTMPVAAGSQISTSLAPPPTSRERRSSPRRSQVSFHMPPFRETSQGTAGLSQMADLATRQSKASRCRLVPIVTVPPSTLISGTLPSNLAR